MAITSSIHPDSHTHIEPVRYGRGSNSMGLLQTMLTDILTGKKSVADGAKWADDQMNTTLNEN